jgi:hypothetical protein
MVSDKSYRNSRIKNMLCSSILPILIEIAPISFEDHDDTCIVWSSHKLGGSEIMRLGILVIPSLFVLVLFAINACSVDWDNPDSQSVDQMIAGPDQGVVIPSSVPVETPQKSREAQIGQPGRDILSVPLGSNSSSEASNPQQARNQELNQTPITEPTVTNSTVPVQPKTSSEPTAASGSWSLVLNDSTSRTAVLTLFQDGNILYGTGNLNLDANTTLIAAASGTISGDKLNLDIVSLGRVSLYRISMILSGNSATGSYTAFDPSSASTTGTAEGIRSVP